jgi:hypothetical protein
LAQPRDTAGSPSAVGRIDPLSAYSFCRALASPEFEGRLTGHPGYDKAARWAAGLFEKWGLRPGCPEGFLQPFPLETTTVEQASMSLTLPPSGPTGGPQEQNLEPGKDFLPLLFSDSGDHTGEVVFVGWGISAPELGYDDYAGVEARGRFALCFRGVPDPSDTRWRDHDEHRTRMRLAKDKGALGLIYIYDEPIASPNGDWIAGFTPAMIGQRVADLILKEKGLQSAALRGDLEKYKRPLSFETRSRLRLTVQSSHTDAATGYNVVGLIPGSDPAVRQEYVIVGAHFDHCGRHMGILFPGANDNASGSASVMEIARVLGTMHDKPRRSILVALFGAEESGLKGSAYLAEHLPPSLGKPIAMINIDMSGAGEGARCGYSADPPALKAILDQADAGVKTLRGSSPIRGVGVRSSDFAPFFLKGIPCLSCSSNGPHLQYHQSGDTIYRINPDMLADVARLAFLAATGLADR